MNGVLTVLRTGMRMYNSLYKSIFPVHRPIPDSPEIRDIEASIFPSKKDICDHLSTIFAEAIAISPRLIVELGVRDGCSRFSLEKVAKLSNSFLVSVDVEDCSAACTRSNRWHFVQQDDIKFADAFTKWCHERGTEPCIDLLFIDTSHLYDHTRQEIEVWFPFLSQRCKVMFHDTNLKHLYRRLDGTIGRGWNNRRGVIRAIEDYLGTKFNERLDFVTTLNEWVIRHWAHCNGFTVLERIPRNCNGAAGS